ncbi:hypothetical protein ACQJBY_026959 [Aegilops geniculata]
MVALEEPSLARHRGRAAATTRGPPPAGVPSFSTTRHQQRRTPPPSTPSHGVQPLTPPETLARIPQRQLKEGGGPWISCTVRAPSLTHGWKVRRPSRRDNTRLPPRHR